MSTSTPTTPTAGARHKGGDAAYVDRARPVPRWWRDASVTAFWGLLLWVTALWVADGGVQDLGIGLPAR